MEYIGESISVIASFGLPYKVRPVRFRWSGKILDVKEITYTWTTNERQSKVYHFSISDGKTLYELSFDTSSLLWRLEGLDS
ncbi:MAG TPA: hypothetical protein VFG09_08365 [Thermodesulfovibrionales bacterium]|nr:hypothetical protein [Thermodesulfovibrionales bacterium]